MAPFADPMSSCVALPSGNNLSDRSHRIAGARRCILAVGFVCAAFVGMAIMVPDLHQASSEYLMSALTDNGKGKKPSVVTKGEVHIDVSRYSATCHGNTGGSCASKESSKVHLKGNSITNATFTWHVTKPCEGHATCIPQDKTCYCTADDCSGADGACYNDRYELVADDITLQREIPEFCNDDADLLRRWFLKSNDGDSVGLVQRRQSQVLFAQAPRNKRGQALLSFDVEKMASYAVSTWQDTLNAFTLDDFGQYPQYRIQEVFVEVCQDGPDSNMVKIRNQNTAYVTPHKKHQEHARHGPRTRRLVEAVCAD